MAAGHRAIVSPLLVWRGVEWALPEGAFDGVLLTSARALHGAGVARVTHLPAWTVGPATSAAARAAGFTQAREGPGGGGQALLDGLAGAGRLLWLAAAERTALVAPPGVTLVPVVTYAMDLGSLSEEAAAALGAGAIDWALLTSARAARRFAAEVDRLGVARAAMGVGAISAAVLAAAGDGWRAGVAAWVANEAGVLGAIGVGVCGGKSEMNALLPKPSSANDPLRT